MGVTETVGDVMMYGPLVTARASDSMFYPLTVRVTNCFYDYDYVQHNENSQQTCPSSLIHWCILHRPCGC